MPFLAGANGAMVGSSAVFADPRHFVPRRPAIAPLAIERRMEV
jgi:hypothetical protein